MIITKCICISATWEELKEQQDITMTKILDVHITKAHKKCFYQGWPMIKKTIEAKEIYGVSFRGLKLQQKEKQVN